MNLIDMFAEQKRSEGREEGRRALLLEQLGHRFGEPSESVRRRVSDASTEQLDRWAERILSADTLDAVLGD